MTEEALRDIRNKYPNISIEELNSLDHEEWNKCSISLIEKLSIEYKNQLQDLFKNHKSMVESGVSVENIEWLKENIRDLKNSVESTLKTRILEQQYLRGGLNRPFCYKH